MSDSAPKRILIIDDEPALLDSLTRVMRPLKNEWEIQVESSPKAALERLATERFDVVVTDLRLPVLNGVPVVSQVMERSPDSIRVTLSSPTEPPNQLAFGPSHHVMARSTELEGLRETVERISRMRIRMHDENMRALISEIDGLPAMPAVCQELNRTLAQDDFSMRDVASVVEKDPALCAKILQLVNSPFFGLNRKLTQLHDAVSYLGTSMLKNLVASVTLWRTLEGVRPSAIAQLSRVHGRCQRVGGLARRIMGKDRLRAEEAFVSGLLHDIGVTMLIAYLPERYDRITAEMLNTGLSFYEVERSLYSVDHAEIGAHLLDAWGLPFQVLEAVAFHSSAPNLRHTRLEPADAVYIAQALLDARDRNQDLDECIDTTYLAQLGAQEQLTEWCTWLEEA
jgi:HD-like signal output (HDOD) protein/CheY-like chemotaxis protein